MNPFAPLKPFFDYKKYTIKKVELLINAIDKELLQGVELKDAKEFIQMSLFKLRTGIKADAEQRRSLIDFHSRYNGFFSWTQLWCCLPYLKQDMKKEIEVEVNAKDVILSVLFIGIAISLIIVSIKSFDVALSSEEFLAKSAFTIVTLTTFISSLFYLFPIIQYLSALNLRRQVRLQDAELVSLEK
ncbi:hypothetical protein [Pleionea sp. CnH1-48]|uniref:hypothetical protein n=1 Tax=Pleionea sp. CnH1-48 TaxID=2954494 RepID=UPI0020975BBE|nr:hypothetical protein [Pleionea sp. CnH1-48]MCO7225751.1 hypothetical protein [Pleionea sp. CnH1-48]